MVVVTAQTMSAGLSSRSPSVEKERAQIFRRANAAIFPTYICYADVSVQLPFSQLIMFCSDHVTHFHRSSRKANTKDASIGQVRKCAEAKAKAEDSSLLRRYKE